jgi:hypothetical protein
MPLRLIPGLGRAMAGAWRQSLRMKNRHFYALKQELFIIILPFEWTIRRAGLSK